MVCRVETVDPAKDPGRGLIVATLRRNEPTDESRIQRPPTAVVGSLIKASRE
jgi:hypothetical protein